ncbi:hypothetical protein A7A08_01577 [Methyloligella halotolerans]|uniref:DUF1192 domain-containing protein n=1 Tax=Methyloligella halotolerans TaxID=1177755 RepID=A0A1E2RZ80_9HYPH|nr:DUF1192 domain-containing protein [Methyloligella halotolerans]ODA67543.1 hypothetical protein A7A08_01577 [Methyloligella halotolerans]
MDWSDLEPKKPEVHSLGADLSKLSVDELKDLAQSLRDEIARVEAVLEAKKASKDAAESAFKS